jgi:hypothetical protein
MVADHMKNEVQPRRGEIINRNGLPISDLNLVINNAASPRLLEGVSLPVYHNFAPPALFYPAVSR